MSEKVGTVTVEKKKPETRDEKILDIIEKLLILPRLSKRARTYIEEIRRLVEEE